MPRLPNLYIIGKLEWYNLDQEAVQLLGCSAGEAQRVESEDCYKRVSLQVPKILPNFKNPTVQNRISVSRQMSYVQHIFYGLGEGEENQGIYFVV